jgi:hypothetical protein
MANSTASIIIKPTVALDRGDTFVFGSWDRIADGAGSFQRHLTMTPNPKTGLVTLTEVVTSTLTEKFNKISLYNQHANFEFGSTSSSNSTSPWVIACERAPEPSCETTPLHEHFPYENCNSSRAHVEALAARQTGKEIASEYSSDSTSHPATTRTLRTSSTSGRTQPSPSPRSTQPRNRCQALLPVWSYIYSCWKICVLARSQACRPDGRQLTLRRLPRHTSLPKEDPIGSKRGAYSHRGGNY